MNVAFTGIRVTVGAVESRLRMSEIEKLAAPLLMVASTSPSGESAIPYGFGASTPTSTPAGVRILPFGRIAAS
jgi:hypothetical protein